MFQSQTKIYIFFFCWHVLSRTVVKGIVYTNLFRECNLQYYIAIWRRSSLVFLSVDTYSVWALYIFHTQQIQNTRANMQEGYFLWRTVNWTLTKKFGRSMRTSNISGSLDNRVFCPEPHSVKSDNIALNVY